MAVIKAGGLSGLMVWAAARVNTKGDIEVPVENKSQFDDFRKHLGQCPEVCDYSISYMPGSPSANVKVTLSPGAKLPHFA